MPCAWHVAPVGSAFRRSLYHSRRAIRVRNREQLFDTRETANAPPLLRADISSSFPGCALGTADRVQPRQHVDGCQMVAGISFRPAHFSSTVQYALSRNCFQEWYRSSASRMLITGERLGLTGLV